MSFDMIMQNPNMVEKQNCIIWMQNNFIVYIKTDNIYKDILQNVETRFDTQIMNLIDHCLKEKIKK